jgi:Na+-transporting NADH:ubiquinone oxidoreductase subunit NqrF
MRYDTELFWLDDFIDLQKSFPNFTFVPIISKPSDDWSLSTGRITSVLPVVDLIPNSDYYLCGAPAAINEVREILQSRSIPNEKIKFEQY